MRNLVNFIFKNIHWLLFVLFISLSVFLIVKNNQFQRSKYLQAVQEVTGYIYSVTNRFYSYLHLKSANTDLLLRVAQLETEVHSYRRQLADFSSHANECIPLGLDSAVYNFIPAQVVNNKVSLLENYIMLDKGSNDGIQSQMGVLSANGIVGVIVNTSPHFSTAISLLNVQYKPNGKIRHVDSDYFGPLVWDGKDAQYTYLTEIPRHVDFDPGDTVVTSGYSDVFPKGIPIGSIVDAQRQQDDNYMSIRIRLFTDFRKLNDVLIVTNRFQQEQQELEKRTLNLKSP